MPVLTFNLVNGSGHSSPDDPSLLLANDCAISKLIALTNRRRSSQQKKNTDPASRCPPYHKTQQSHLYKQKS
jgi:hypothetical protein